MVEYLRIALWRTVIPEHRNAMLAVAAATGFATAAVLAGPTVAAPPPGLTVDTNQRLNADGSVTITGTYTCSGGRANSIRSSGLRQGDADSSAATKPAVLVICDGTARPYKIEIPNTQSFPFVPGPAQFSTTWNLYIADGNTPTIEITDAPVTLQE